MQLARCYLLGETAVVLELEPPVTLESQKRIWGLTQRLTDREEVVEVIPGMNNITVVLRRPQEMAWEAIDKLQRWWEESDALEPESREISIPVIYGGEAGPDLGDVARHSGLSEKQGIPPCAEPLHDLAALAVVISFTGKPKPLLAVLCPFRKRQQRHITRVLRKHPLQKFQKAHAMPPPAHPSFSRARS